MANPGNPLLTMILDDVFARYKIDMNTFDKELTGVCRKLGISISTFGFIINEVQLAGIESDYINSLADENY